MKNQRKTRILALVMTLALVLGLLPGTALATGEAGTEENPINISTSGLDLSNPPDKDTFYEAGEGSTAVWTPATEGAPGTLTLSGRGEITAGATSLEFCGIYLPAAAKVVVKDSANWTVTGGGSYSSDSGSGLYSRGALDLTLEAGATLTLQGGNAANNSPYTGSGLYAHGFLTLTVAAGAALTAGGGNGAVNRGIYAKGVELDNNGTVYATGTGSGGVGLYSSRAPLTVTGGGALYCTGDVGIYVSYANLNFQGGVTVALGTRFGIQTDGSVTVDGKASLAVAGGTAGILASSTTDNYITLSSSSAAAFYNNATSLDLSGVSATALHDNQTSLDLSGVTGKTLYILQHPTSGNYAGLALWTPGTPNKLDCLDSELHAGIILPNSTDATLDFSGQCSISNNSASAVRGGGDLTLSTAPGGDVLLGTMSGTYGINAGGAVTFAGGIFHIKGAGGAVSGDVTVTGGAVELYSDSSSALANNKTLTVTPPAGLQGVLALGESDSKITKTLSGEDARSYSGTDHYIKVTFETPPAPPTPDPLPPTPDPLPPTPDPLPPTPPTPNQGSDDSGSNSPSPAEQAASKADKAKDGDTVEISLPSNGKLDGKVLEAAAGKDVTLEINAGNGVTWILNGKDVPTGQKLSDLNLKVDTKASTIPVNVINAVTGEQKVMQLVLSHNGAFPIPLTLRLDTGSENAGLFANLYYYNETTGALEYQATAEIGSDGSADIPFDHASSYAVVIDKESHAPAEPPFTDVSKGDWCYDAVAYVYQKGLMVGTTDTTFSPNGVVTRAQVWTVLARMAGQEVSGSGVFEQARRWAVDNSVSDGTNPDGTVSREQLATMLYRYAGSPAAPNLVLDFTDTASVADYAQDALRWAMEQGAAVSLTPRARPHGPSWQRSSSGFPA